MRIVSMSYLVRVGKTHCWDPQDPSKSIPIFERGTEANSKMVPIYRVPIPRSRTVLAPNNLRPGARCEQRWTLTTRREAGSSTFKGAEEQHWALTLRHCDAAQGSSNHGWLDGEHQRKVKNTQNYEFHLLKKRVLSIPLALSLRKHRGERKNFWAWYKSKIKHTDGFVFVPVPEMFSLAPSF